MNHSSSLKASTFYCGNILQPLLLYSLFPSYCFYCFIYFCPWVEFMKATKASLKKLEFFWNHMANPPQRLILIRNLKEQLEGMKKGMVFPLD